MSEPSKNRNLEFEYRFLRDEILEADKTCVVIMGFLVTMTGAAGSAFTGALFPFVGWLLSPIWFFGFIYLTEKRFVIKVIYTYLLERIEPYEETINWESFRNEQKLDGNLRPIFPFNPYHLEAVVCGIVIATVPFLGIFTKLWSYLSFYFISGCALMAVFIFLSIRAFRIYRNYQIGQK